MTLGSVSRCSVKSSLLKGTTHRHPQPRDPVIQLHPSIDPDDVARACHDSGKSLSVRSRLSGTRSEEEQNSVLRHQHHFPFPVAKSRTRESLQKSLKLTVESRSEPFIRHSSPRLRRCGQPLFQSLMTIICPFRRGIPPSVYPKRIRQDL